MNSELDLKAIATKWFAAFNERNLENLLALYDDDAQHYSPKLKIHRPETNGMVRGKAALRAWWQDAFDRLPTLKYTPTSLTADTDRIFVEYIRSVAKEPDMFIAEVLQIKDGMIIASRVYHG
jgi:ketosteroid isomerase-like protein